MENDRLVSFAAGLDGRLACRIDDDAQMDRLAAHFAIFDVCLVADGRVHDDLDRLAAIRAGEVDTLHADRLTEAR